MVVCIFEISQAVIVPHSMSLIHVLCVVQFSNLTSVFKASYYVHL